MDDSDEGVNVQNLYFSSEHVFEPGLNNRALFLECHIMSLLLSSRLGDLSIERNCFERFSLCSAEAHKAGS